jgi:polysaccharide biosynthesis/export protein
MKCSKAGKWAAMGVLLAICAGATGCLSCRRDPELCASSLPRELTKVTLPTYTIAPPDILLVDAVRVIPKPPYHAQPLDVLLIQVTGVLQEEPIVGPYPIGLDGTVNLGLHYGSVRVVGLTLEEIKDAIEKELKLRKFTKPEAVVMLGQSRALQQIRGEHLVRPDGTVGLGTYGDVTVVGLTLAEAKTAMENHLSQHLQNPELSVDVLAYNSKVIYVILDGGGSGQQVVRLPVTGNDTVLDIMSQVGGLTPVSSKHRIWVARPGPACAPCDQILPVDWVGITTRGRTESNYQLMPGDRVYVEAQPLVSIDTYLARLFSPMERIFGVTLLGRGLVGTLSQPLNQNGTGGSGSGF